MAQKEAAAAAAFRQLKAQIKEGQVPCGAYLFYGKEQYLLRYYLDRLRRCLLPAGAETFNFHALDGRETTVQEVAERIEAMPLGAERTVVTVTDWDLFRLPQDQREGLTALLADLPDYCCLIFVYDTIDYQPNRSMKKLCAAIDAYVTAVEFKTQEAADLTAWVARRFRSLGKDIDRQTAEYLLFLCGQEMTGLVQEISKIAAYAQGERITQREIDAAADPILSAEVFKLTDAVTQGRYDRACEIFGDLLKMQEEPVAILGALGGQLRRLYTARLALDCGLGRTWLMEIWQMRSDYPAKLLMQSAQRTSLAWCRRSVALCRQADADIKSRRGREGQEVLKLLLARLGTER